MKLIDGKQVKLELKEGAPGSLGRVVVRGEFARADEATANGRIYPRGLWEAQISRLNEAMGDMKVLGELDHPDDGRTLLQRVSHVVTGLHIAPDGVVVGEAVILDTARGRDLKAMLSAGCKVGVSSRGFGTTVPHPTMEGREIVSEDYQLDTFDFVAQPADQHAFPKVFGESIYQDKPNCLYEGYTMSNAAPGKKKDAGKPASKTEGAPAPAASPEQVLDIATKIRSEVTEQVRKELMSDPAVAGAKATLEKIGKDLTPFILPESVQTLVEEKDQEIARLRKVVEEKDAALAEHGPRTEKLEGMLKKTGYRLFIEQRTALMPRAEATEIKRAIGDVMQYENAAALSSKMESIQKMIADRKAAALKERQERERQERAIQEARMMERRAFERREKAMEEEKAKLAEATQKLLNVVETQRIQLHIEERLKYHPQRAKLEKVIEKSGPTSTEAVDAIIEANTSRTNDAEAASEARARVRQFHGSRGGGRSVSAAYEETLGREDRRPVQESYDDLPIDLSDFDHLAGVEPAAARRPRR